MKTPPFAVLFDLDGVLINTEPSHLVAFDAVSELFGFTTAEMRAAGRKGGSIRDRYRRLQALRPFPADDQTFSNAILERMFTHLEKTNVRADPALVRFLKELRDHGIPKAIGTSSLGWSAARKLEILGIAKEFNAIVTADDAEHHKPHPEVYLTAAAKLGVPPAQCIVIEDAADGIQAGKAAGMKVVGFKKYADPEDADLLDQAHLVVNGFEDLNYQTLLDLLR